MASVLAGVSVECGGRANVERAGRVWPEGACSLLVLGLVALQWLLCAQLWVVRWEKRGSVVWRRGQEPGLWWSRVVQQGGIVSVEYGVQGVMVRGESGLSRRCTEALWHFPAG